MTTKTRNPRKFVPMFHVGVRSGKVLLDDLQDSIGHIYDRAKYDADGNRHSHKVVEASTSRATFHVEDHSIEFDPDTFCEACFQKGRGEQELRIKTAGQTYCPCCGVTRRHVL